MCALDAAVKELTQSYAVAYAVLGRYVFGTVFALIVLVVLAKLEARLNRASPDDDGQETSPRDPPIKRRADRRMSRKTHI